MADSIFKYISQLPDKRTARAFYEIFKRFVAPATEPTDGTLLDIGATLATAAEINRAADLSTRIVSTTAATISVTLASHDGKTVVLASTHTQTLTLPTAAGTGARYKFVVSATGTDGSKVIKVGSTLDNMTGVSIANCTSTNEANGFLTTATDDTITLNNTTTGGIKGTVVEIEDVATNLYSVKVVNSQSGTIATPFSATV
jgi:hypothetical protein